MKINHALQSQNLHPQINRLFDLSAQKILSLEKSWNPAQGTPVFTVQGKYTSRGWTEWTQGFQYGSALLQFEATGDPKFLEIGRKNTVARMASHLTHIGVHDHGFNNISTYGNLRRLMREGRTPFNEEELRYYELALKISGAVQAARWTPLSAGLGYIYSFNGPHSLFVDTLRSLRIVGLAHSLGHVLMGENDRPISLLERLLQHARTTARYNIFYGAGRDVYDVRGRTAHESIFNPQTGRFRCPSTQQGYSPFSTWTRGLAWAILGFAEQLEFLQTLNDSEFEPIPWESVLPDAPPIHSDSAGASPSPAPSPHPATSSSPNADPSNKKQSILDELRNAACACADFYIANTPTDGIPYWDTGAPGLIRLGDYLHRPADPFNDHEPVDSSAAAIAAQGFIRLGKYLQSIGINQEGIQYHQGGLTIAETLFASPYLSEVESHQGLILHSIYHRPNGWDFIPPGSKIPQGESSMWGDYHARELAGMILRETSDKPYPTFLA